MPLEFVVTAAGRAALVNAQHNGTNAVTIAQVGVSGTAIVATPATANLPGEVKRIATISGSAVAPDTMHVIVRDEGPDVFTVRSVAFYLSDGTLFGAYGQPGVLVEKSSQAMLLLAIDVIFKDINAAQIIFGDTNFLNPPATTETAGVIKIATDAEANAMANAVKALSPRGMALAFTAANVLARLLTVDGAGSGLDADLLDGQDGSYYTNIIGRLGYTPANRAGDTFSGTVVSTASEGFRLRSPAPFLSFYADSGTRLGYIQHTGSSLSLMTEVGATTYFSAPLVRGGHTVWDAGNDGAGSGLDADLLDGRQASEFALLAGATFTGALTASGAQMPAISVLRNGIGAWYFGGDGVAGSNRFAIRFNANDPYLSIDTDGTVNIAGSLRQAGAQVWHTANDGAGSGLDADLLDGRQAAEFALLTGAAFTGLVNSAEGFTGASLRATGFTPQATGAGTEIHYTGGGGYLIAYDRTAGAYKPLWIQGSSVTVTTSVAINGSITRAGNTVWDAGNDGAGSGLDADLLDGRQAVEFALLSGAGVFTGTVVSQAAEAFRAAGNTPYIAFTNAAASTRWGYIQHTGAGGALAISNDQAGQIQLQVGGVQPLTLTPSGATVTGAMSVSSDIRRAGNIVWDLGNDGSGSGMDSDLLDGQHGAYYANIAARLGYTPLNGTDFTAANILSRLITVDGSGSGLDADLLDGRHAAEFALLTDATRAGNNANGYWEKRPNGVIEQWGTVAGLYSEGQIAIAFPIPFTDENSIVITPVAINAVASDKYDISIQRVSKTVNGCIVFAQYSAAAASINQINGVDWRAIGR